MRGRLWLTVCLLLWAGPASAQVSFGWSAESHTGTTGSASEGSFSFAATFDATGAEGLIVCTHTFGSTTQKATGVTFDGEALAAVTGGEAVVDDDLDSNTKVWFVSSPHSVNGTLTVTRTNDATVVWASAIALEAATSAETEVYTSGIVLVQSINATIAEQNVTDGSPGTNSVRVACLTSGATTLDDPGANSSASASGIDLGTLTARMVGETTAGQGSRPVGFGDATVTDRSAVHFAIRQTASAVSGYRALVGVGR